jgi:hypothetical protein
MGVKGPGEAGPLLSSGLANEDPVMEDWKEA